MVAAIKFKNVRSILILPFFLISRSGAWWTVLFPSLISKKHRRGSTSTGQADIGACWLLWRMCHLAISVLGGGDGGHNIMDSWNHYLIWFSPSVHFFSLKKHWIPTPKHSKSILFEFQLISCLMKFRAHIWPIFSSNFIKQ